MTILKGITWDHSRGFTSVVATAQRFHQLNPDIDIVWEKRSLQAFADENLEDLSKRYDLLVIDNPWAGTISRGKWLKPINALLSAEYLQDQASNSVGHSHASYIDQGNQWALAIDAACPVNAHRPDLLEKIGADVPVTWDDVMALARKGHVMCPSIPLDVYGNFLNLLKSSGKTIFATTEYVAERADALEALEMLREFQSHIHADYFKLNPIKALERMSQTDSAAYCPFTYGYSNYSRKGYAPKHIRFGSAPEVIPGKAGETMLGGTGLAISSACQHPEIAARYAEFTASGAVQSGVFYEAGGQPGHRSAWVSDEINATCDDYFKRTLKTLDHSFVRPRYAGYLDFQDIAGDPIHEYLREGGDANKVLDVLDQMYRDNRKKNA